MKTRRIAIGATVVALWVVGLLLMLRRNANRSEEQQLAEVALTVQPATFYYLVERDGQPIGAASSAVDTTIQNLVSEEYFVGDFPSPSGKLERTSARWQTTLSRGFRLQRMTIDIGRTTLPFSIGAAVQEDTTLVVAFTRSGSATPPQRRLNFTPPVFTPGLAPVVFMLGGPRDVGRAQTMSVFDATTRTVVRPELKIHAESLFTVVDSAAPDAAGDWAVAHQDTVRAWRIESTPAGISAWVDAEGRVVAAQMPGGLSVLRTAFEIAFRNPQTSK